MCDCCKKYIFLNTESVCLECGEVCVDGRCCCGLGFRTFCVGYRDEPIGALAEMYKFESVRALGAELAEALHLRLPYSVSRIVVPVPTARRHVRQRGLDHALVVARELARLRGWRCDKGLVTRRLDSMQTGAGRKGRIAQAGEAFGLSKEVSAADYLVVDDIWTTGASAKAVVRLLKNAGARSVDVVVLARSR